MDNQRFFRRIGNEFPLALFFSLVNEKRLWQRSKELTPNLWFTTEAEEAENFITRSLNDRGLIG
jgi:hypothetical protein